MKNFVHIAVFFLSAISVCTSCEKEEDLEPTALIRGLTFENFPVIDGSTSTDPLVKMAAARLLGYEAVWKQQQGYLTWVMETNLPKTFVGQHLRCSKTHDAFVKLIDGSVDMIFSARTMSADEKAYAGQAGVDLIELPVAMDALIFMENDANPVNSLTRRQLQDIYAGRTENWSDVGGQDLPIVPFVRNRNSGSQELMESLMMTEPIPDYFFEDTFGESRLIPSMPRMMSVVQDEPGGLGYTVYYYKENIIRGAWWVKTLAVNGVMPGVNTIKNMTYPFAAPVYMIIRSDVDILSTTYQIYGFMQSLTGKRIIEESGYIAR